MNPLLQSFAGMGVRALMMLAGASGVDLGNDQAETIINALLIVGALGWSAFQKWRAHDRITVAEMQAQMAQRRG